MNQSEREPPHPIDMERGIQTAAMHVYHEGQAASQMCQAVTHSLKDLERRLEAHTRLSQAERQILLAESQQILHALPPPYAIVPTLEEVVAALRSAYSELLAEQHARNAESEGDHRWASGELEQFMRRVLILEKDLVYGGEDYCYLWAAVSRRHADLTRLCDEQDSRPPGSNTSF